MAKRSMSLTVSEETNKWLQEIAGKGRGERQKFIISILNMVRSGLIIKGTEIKTIQKDDWKTLAELQAEGRAKGATEGAGAVLITPPDVLQELKKKLKALGLTEETRDTIKAVRDEQRVLSQAFLSPDPSAPPPPPPPKDVGTGFAGPIVFDEFETLTCRYCLGRKGDESCHVCEGTGYQSKDFRDPYDPFDTRRSSQKSSEN